MPSDNLHVGSWRLTAPGPIDADSGLLFGALVHTVKDQARVIVDVGCGRGSAADDTLPGPNLFDYRGPARHVIGIDVDPAGETNRLVDEFRLIDDDLRWPVDDAQVDVVVSDWTLEHVDDPELFVSELRRVLRPGGLFIARSVNRRSLLSVASRSVPNTAHASTLRRFQPERRALDVFPVRYRMNTRSSLRGLLAPHFETRVDYMPGFISYFVRWPRFSKVVRSLERRIPSVLQTVIIVVARKPGGNGA